MTQLYEAPSTEALVAEQRLIQRDKDPDRLLHEYNKEIFPGQDYVPPQGSAVVDLVRPIIGGDGPVALQDLLEGMCANKVGQLEWVDMCGGRALTMRQVACMPTLGDRVRMTSVDILDHALEDLPAKSITYLEETIPGITSADAAPTLIRDNVETVSLPTKPDLITCVEGLQYLNDPLGALANWYNQLADNGFVIIATEHDWPLFLAYDSDLYDGENYITPITHFLEDLPRTGINFAAVETYDDRDGYRPELDPLKTRILALQKKPGTRLEVAKRLTEVTLHYRHYKMVAYEDPTEESPWAIEIIHDRAQGALGLIALEDTLAGSPDK